MSPKNMVAKGGAARRKKDIIFFSIELKDIIRKYERVANLAKLYARL